MIQNINIQEIVKRIEVLALVQELFVSVTIAQFCNLH